MSFSHCAFNINIVKMANALATAAYLYSEDVLDEAEMLVLVEEEVRGSAPIFPYWRYSGFNLESMTEDESLTEFRFNKNDIPYLVNAFGLPSKFICSNGTTASAIEGLCMLLKRLSYPCRYSDMIPRFGRSQTDICLITNKVMRFLSEKFGHLLSSFNQRWLHPDKLMKYAEAVHAKCNALDNCWGFIDGTVRPICRPEENQKVVYNGHKRVHALKYQSVVAANGLIANLYGPIGEFLRSFHNEH